MQRVLIELPQHCASLQSSPLTQAEARLHLTLNCAASAQAALYLHTHQWVCHSAAAAEDRKARQVSQLLFYAPV